MKEPIAEVAATAEPETEPNSMLEMILTTAKPPGSAPINPFAALINRLATPPAPIKYPLRMKKGMASRVKLSRPATIR